MSERQYEKFQASHNQLQMRRQTEKGKESESQTDRQTDGDLGVEHQLFLCLINLVMS